MPAPAFFGGTEPGQWRPTVLTATGEPTPMAVSWLATARPFTVRHASQFFAATPPRLTSRDYTRDYNEVKEFGRDVGSSRTPEQTAIAVFHSGNTLVLWNQTLRSLADRYATNVGDSARLFALVNMAMADACMTAWQAKIQYNVWRPYHGHSTGRERWQPLNSGRSHLAVAVPRPQLPDYTSGANSSAGATTEMLRLVFQTDRVNFSMIGPTAVASSRHFPPLPTKLLTRACTMGIHFRFADTMARTRATRVAR